MKNKPELTQTQPRYDTGLRYDSGVRYASATPLTTNKRMSQIVTNIAGLSISKKLEKSTNIITKSSANPAIPGNGPAVAALSTSQAALDAANAAVIAARNSLKLLMVERDLAEADWDAKCTALADFTQVATGGEETAILSSGYAVREPNAPVGRVGIPENLTARTNGSVGVTKLRWKAVPGAINYLIQCSPDLITESSFVLVGSSPKANTEISGAVPGKVCWFRVAAVGAADTGSWSSPAQRPVM